MSVKITDKWIADNAERIGHPGTWKSGPIPATRGSAVKAIRALLRSWRKRQKMQTREAIMCLPRIYEINQAVYKGMSSATELCCKELEALANELDK